MQFDQFVLAACALSLCSIACAAENTSGTKPLGFGPISYFEDHCANCHGSMGSDYGDKFGAGLSDAKLAQVVKEMCDGPGNAPLEGEELKAEIAFHRSLAKHQPFVSWTETKANKLIGEAPPGSKVWVVTASGQTSATLEEARWNAEMPASSDLSSAAVHVSKDGSTTVLSLGESSYSHSKP